MQIVRGLYKNGVVELEQLLPVDNVIVEVIIPEMIQMPTHKNQIKGLEALRALEKYRGRMNPNIDIIEERDKYLNEKLQREPFLVKSQKS
jgi:hypothetical protein